MNAFSTNHATQQYLTFTLAGEIYALEVSKTREVVAFTNITRIPKTPDWIRGVLNLRGTVVPVLDLKLRLGMGTTERTAVACVIILELVVDGEPMSLGVLADSVQEVVEFEAAQIEPPPKLGGKVSSAYLRGLGRRGESLVVILDGDRVFASSEIEIAADCVAAADPWAGTVEETGSPGGRLGAPSEPEAAAPHAETGP